MIFFYLTSLVWEKRKLKNGTIVFGQGTGGFDIERMPHPFPSIKGGGISALPSFTMSMSQFYL